MFHSFFANKSKCPRIVNEESGALIGTMKIVDGSRLGSLRGKFFSISFQRFLDFIRRLPQRLDDGLQRVEEG